VQSLLLKLVEQGERARQVTGLVIELTQETVAESHAARVKSALNELQNNGDGSLRNTQGDSIEAARRYAYNLAREILRQSNPT